MHWNDGSNDPWIIGYLPAWNSFYPRHLIQWQIAEQNYQSMNYFNELQSTNIRARSISNESRSRWNLEVWCRGNWIWLTKKSVTRLLDDRATECSSLDKTGNVRTKSHVTLNKMKIRSRFLSKQSFSIAESFRKREREMEELKD